MTPSKGVTGSDAKQGLGIGYLGQGQWHWGWRAGRVKHANHFGGGIEGPGA